MEINTGNDVPIDPVDVLWMRRVILDQLVNEPSHEGRANPFAGMESAVHKNGVLPTTITSVRVRNGDEWHFVTFVTFSGAGHRHKLWVGEGDFVNECENLIQQIVWFLLMASVNIY